MRLSRIVICALLAFGGLWTLLTQIGAQILMRRRPPDPPDPPSNYGIPYEEIYLNSRDGTPLYGWWIPAAQARGTLVMCHGQSGSMDRDTHQMVPLHRAGFNVLMFDFRAHGRSGGNLLTMGMYEKEDLLGVIDYLAETRHIERVGVLGFSMGAATALIAASLTGRIAAVVADSSFSRFKNTLARHLNLYGVPYRLAWQLAAWTLVACAIRTKGRMDQVDTVLWMPHVSCPVLLIHGSADWVVSPQEVDELAARAAGPVTVWTVEGAGHRGTFKADPVGYNRRVIEWFRQHLESASEPAAFPHEEGRA